MSTRYVYSVYNSTVGKSTVNVCEVSSTSTYSYLDVWLCNAYEAKTAYDRSMNPVTLYIASGDDIFSPVHDSATATRYYSRDTLLYKYCIVTNNVPSSETVRVSYLLELSRDSGAYWHIKTVGATSSFGTIQVAINDVPTASPVGEDTRTNFYQTGGDIKKGSTLLYSESSGSKNLAEGGFQSEGSWKWREYRGSDNIDPSAVTYSKSELQAGDSVTVRVTPRSPVYGGTVYYQYQYSINGGSSWTTITSRTTSTSVSVTIPGGATQFRARVRASDNIGFTSSTYVTGAALSVSQLKAYGTVNSITKTLSKGWCVVDGVVKDLSKGYVTVDGVWKKLF